MELDMKYTMITHRLKPMLNAASSEVLAADIRGQLLGESDDWALLVLSVIEGDKLINMINEVKEPSINTTKALKKYISGIAKKMGIIYRPTVLNDPLGLDVYKLNYRFTKRPSMNRYILEDGATIEGEDQNYFPPGKVTMILPYGFDWKFIFNVNGKAIHKTVKNHGLDNEMNIDDMVTHIPYKLYSFNHGGKVYEIRNGNLKETEDVLIKRIHTNGTKVLPSFGLLTQAVNIATGEQGNGLIPFNRERSI